MQLPPSSLKEFIQSHTNFIVAGHSEPDGDCLCSSITLTSLLRRYGKEAIAFNEGPFSRSEIEDWESNTVSKVPQSWLSDSEKTAVIIVDCSTPDRIGSLSHTIKQLPTAVIDHHASGISFGNVRFIDTESPSTTLLVKRVATLLDLKLNKEEASNIFFGFCTDTGYFKHLSYKRHLELKEVADLMKSGADPKACYQKMTGGKTFQSRQLLGIILSRAESFYNNSIFFVYDTQEEMIQYGEESRDADALYSQLFAIKGCEAIIYIKYRDEHSFSAGLRSIKNINVGEVAATLNGGGHKLASGLKFEGNFETLKAKLLDLIIQPQFKID